MEFSRQEYWSELPFPFTEGLQNQGLNLALLHCRPILYYLSHQGNWVAKTSPLFHQIVLVTKGLHHAQVSIGVNEILPWLNENLHLSFTQSQKTI